MKKTYKKLESDLLLVETEGGFMTCSIENAVVKVEPYQDQTFQQNEMTTNQWEMDF